MPILDVFKKKKKEKVTKLPEKQAEIKREEIKKEKPKKEAVLEKKIKEKKTGESWRILKSPHVTEKATDLTKKNQYVFKVFPKANKSEIRKTIEGLYGVDVISVKIINIPPKKRRLGKISGWKPGYKKAIIGIEEGQKIEVLPR